MKTSKRKRVASTTSKCPCCPLPSKQSKHSRPQHDPPVSTSTTVHNVASAPLLVSMPSQHCDDTHQAESEGARRPTHRHGSRRVTPHVMAFPTGLQSEDLQAPHPLPLPRPAAATPGQPTSTPSSSEESSDDSEAEGFPSFPTTVQNHLHNLLPGNGVHYQESISTPIISQIKSSLCKDIWRNKFVDLAALLPNNAISTQPKFTLQLDSDSNISIAPSSRPQKIHSIEMWTTAFIRFMAVYTTKFPTESPQMLKYMEVVRDLAFTRPGPAFLQYDTQFRLTRVSTPIPWDYVMFEFWLRAYAAPSQQHSFRPQLGNFPHRSSKFRSKQQSRFQQNMFLENTCWNYNKMSGCHRPRCSIPHICGFCRGPHTAFNCSFPNKEEAALSHSNKKQAPAQNKPNK